MRSQHMAMAPRKRVLARLAWPSAQKQSRHDEWLAWSDHLTFGLENVFGCKQNDSERRGCSETLRDHKQNMTDSIWFIVNAYDFSTLANTSVYIFIFIFNYLVLYQVLSKFFTYTIIQIYTNIIIMPFVSYLWFHYISSYFDYVSNIHPHRLLDVPCLDATSPRKGPKGSQTARFLLFHYLLLHESQVNMLFIIFHMLTLKNRWCNRNA